MNKKTVITGLLLICVLFYGFSVGYFRIFPFNLMQTAKFYIESKMDLFEGTQQSANNLQDIEIMDTVLQRLLIKKVPIPGYSGHGGGISTAGNRLFHVSNKGKIKIFNLDTIASLKASLPDVPMNLDQLILSGYPSKDNFKILWFRVNGVYAEKNEQQDEFTLFASHNAYNSELDCITHNVSRIDLEIDGDTVSSSKSWKTIFTASPCIDPEPEYILAAVPYPGHISGGDIEPFSDEQLLITVGDYNRHGIDGTDKYAMDRDNPYGKHLLIDKKTGVWTIYAVGNRNPSGIHIDNEGVIWSVENGPEAGDELNLIEEGENYGWPDVSYGYWYDAEFSLPGNQPYGTHKLHTSPVFSWVPSVAPSSIIRIEGSKFDLWSGDLLVGTMGNQSVRRLRLNVSNDVVYDEPIRIGHRIRDMDTLPDDKILLLTDDGFLIFIEDGGPAYKSGIAHRDSLIAGLNRFDQLNPTAKAAHLPAENMTGETIFQQKCGSCHNLNGNSQIGPHLEDLLNRTVGGADDFNYSITLRQDNRKWTPELLESFLRNPENEFSGNRMQKIELSEEETGLIIEYLEEKSTVSKVNNP